MCDLLPNKIILLIRPTKPVYIFVTTNQEH